jgi:hypothetical protein
MDQRTNIVEQDIKDIVQTRLEISRKLQLLDQKARYEFENVKAKWSGLTGNVAETGRELIDQSTRALNPVRQMNARPWVALAGVVLAGYAIGMLEKQYRRPKVYPYYPQKAQGVPVMPTEGTKEGGETRPGVYPYFPEGTQETERKRASSSPRLWSEMKGTVHAEIQRVKDAAGYALREFMRDMTKEIVPTILKSITSASHGSRR